MAVSGQRRVAVTEHRIYVTLSTPKAPWDWWPLFGKVPDLDVLDHACVWAMGQTTHDGVLSKVTEKVNSELGLTYNSAGGGAAAYVDATTNLFKMTAFQQLLDGKTGQGKVVNCTDCSTIVTIFANILGCDSYTSLMNNTNNINDTRFETNSIMAIDSIDWGPPFPNDPHFSYHEVTFSAAAGGGTGASVYDACLQVDMSLNPWTWRGTGHIPRLPQGMRFSINLFANVPLGQPYTDKPLSYRERLCANTVNGIPMCLPAGEKSGTNDGRRTW
jgi:hypothetical protein